MAGVPTPVVMPGRSKASLLLGGLCVARFAAFIFRLHVVPFFTDFAATYRVSYLEAGLLLSFFLAGYSVVLIPVGLLTDRVRPERMLALGACLFAAGSGLFALGGSWGLLLTSRVILGAGAALIYVPTLKLIAVHFAAAQRGRLLGLAELAGGVGTLTGLSIFPAIAPWIPNRWLTLAVGLGSLIAAGAVVRGAGGTSPVSTPMKAPRFDWKLLSGAPLLLCGITGATIFGWTSFVGWTPTYLEEGLGLARPTVALITGLSTVVQLTSSYWAGQISDRTGRRWPVLVAGLLLAAGGMAMYLLLPSWPGAVAAGVLTGVGAAFALNACMTLSTELLGPERAGSLVSLTAMAGMLSGAIAGTVDGWIRDVTGSYVAVWAVAAAVLGVTTLASLRLRGR